MAITTTTPYKSGTLSSIGTGANGPNTRLNTSGITWAAGDVGRHVYFYSGNARLESREIIAQGTNYCDIIFPFGEYPVLKPDGNEVDSNTPSASDSVGVSHQLDDIDDGVTLIKDSANKYRHVTANNWTIGANVMIHDINKSIEWDSQYIDLDGIMQLGNLDASGNPKEVCNVVETCASFGGFSSSGNLNDDTDDFGSFRMFGGSMISVGTQFLRMYQTATPTNSRCVQVHGVNMDGGVGCRFGGEGSYFDDVAYSNIAGSITPVNAKSDVDFIRGIRVNSGSQVVYHHWDLSQTLTVPGIRFEPDEITTQFARLNNGSSGYTLTLDDIILADIQALQDKPLTVFNQDSAPSTSNTIKITNPLTVATQNGTSGFRLRIKNGAGTEVYDASSDGNGDWAKASYEWGSLTVNALDTYDLDDFTEAGPYSCNARKYDKITQTFDFDAEAALTTTVPDVTDASIVQATKATVDAYTTLETMDKLRDRWKSEHVDTDDLEDCSAGGGAVSLAASTDINATYDAYSLVIDATAASAFAESSGTITIKASTLAKGSSYTKLTVPANETLAFANSADMSADLELLANAVATIADLSVLTGDVDITGRLDVSQLSSDALTGSGAAAGRIKINGSTNWKYLDLRNYNVASGFTVENNSGAAVIILQNTGDTAPTLVETSGGLSVLTGIHADTVIRKNGANYEFYTPIRYTVTSGGSPVSGVAVGWFDSGDNDRTYTDGYVNGALTSDGSGVVDGLVLFRVDATTYTGFNLIAGKAGYSRYKVAATENVTSIDIGILLASDAFYTTSPSSNTTIDFGAATITQAGNDTVQGIYDYAMQQWLTATNMYRDQPFVGSGAAFEIGDGYSMTISSGNVSGDPIQIASGETLTVSGGDLQAGANVIGTLAAANNGLLSGTINMQGGTLDLADMTTDQMTGSFASGTIDLDDLSTPTTTTLDLRAVSSLGSGLTIKNDSDEDITVKIIPTQSNPTLDVTGPGTGTLTINNNLPLTLPNIINGSRVFVYNVTKDTEVDNDTVSGGGGYSYDATGAEIAVDDEIRIWVAYQSGASAKLGLEITGTWTTSGFSSSASQTDDSVYNSNAIDGSGVTECSADGANLEIDVDDPDGTTTAQRIYAWLVYHIQTENGIDLYFGAMTAIDEFNYRINTAVVDLLIENTGATALLVRGGRLYRDDNTSIFKAGTNAQLDPGLLEFPWTAPIDGSYTGAQVMRALAAALAGKVSGAASNAPVFRDLGDTKDRITATTDDDGNRSAVTLDLD